MKKRLKTEIKRHCVNSKILKRPFNFLLFHKRKLNYRLKYLNNPIDDKLIVFESFMGRKYACSPKAIYEYMPKRNQPRN